MGIIVRQSIKATIVNYIGTFIGFVTTMFVITKYLSPEDLGLTRVLLEIAMLFAGLAQLGTGASIFRFFPYFRNKNNHHNGFFFYTMCLPLLGCVIFIAIYLIAKQPITAFFIEKSRLLINYYYWIIPLIVFFTYIGVLEAYSNVNMRIVVPKFNREIILRTLLLAVYLLFGLQLVGRNGMVAGIVLAHGVVLLCIFAYVARTTHISLRHDTTFVTPAMRSDIFKYTLFLIAGTLGGAIIGKLDLFMISSQMGLSHAGVYTIAFYIATMLEIPSRSISSIASPVAANALKEGDFQQSNALYQKVALHQLLAGGFIFLLVWINIDNIFAIIPNGSVYAEGKWVVFFVGLAKLVSITLSFGGTMIQFSKYYYWSLYFTLFIAGAGILTNYWLIPRLGIVGAAVATLLTCLLSYLAQQWIVLKKIKGNPYTRNLLKTIVLLFIGWGVNLLLAKLANPWMDGLYRTMITIAVCTVLLYLFNVSEDVNNTILVILRRVRKFLDRKNT
ncbi:hypothetical protein FACS189452_01280 [Bacteroidia bacterium]|nr:hypothetical protein FACS189452_01280 [Bacteroidia bacterium]